MIGSTRRGVAAAWGATLVLFAVYAATLARGVTYWDAGEFLSAVHSLGIPHPPGTPLFILLARVWSDGVAPLTGFTIAVNAFSAACTAVACGVLAHLVWRWTGDALAAFAAALCAGATSTLWLNATETEVYACSLCAAVLILWTAWRATETHDARWGVLTLYLCGLSWALHLTALLAAPTALLLLLYDRWRTRTDTLSLPRMVFVWGVIAVLGASAVLFMLVRARHDPYINQGNPVTWHALWNAVQRHQYDVAAPWPRRAPFWLQLGNVIEYADWQFALGLSPAPGASWLRTPVTLLFLLAGVYGCLTHRRRDRLSWRALLLFFVTTTLGVVVYLNLRAGPSFGYGVLPDGVLREARERDYFFTFGFLCWGLWAGYGAVSAARRARVRWLPVVALVFAAAPIVLNWSAIRHERVDEQRAAERDAITILSSVPPNGVLLAHGDNDTYPLWYMQEARGLRRDVVIVTVPLLGPTWYREELVRRHALLSIAFAQHWYGLTATIAEIRRCAAVQGRPVVVSTFVQRSSALMGSELLFQGDDTAGWPSRAPKSRPKGSLDRLMVKVLRKRMPNVTQYTLSVCGRQSIASRVRDGNRTRTGLRPNVWHTFASTNSATRTRAALTAIGGYGACLPNCCTRSS